MTLFPDPPRRPRILLATGLVATALAAAILAPAWLARAQAPDAAGEPLPEIYQFSIEARPEAGAFSYPDAIASGNDGSVYVLDDDRLLHFDADGAFRNRWGSIGGEEGRFSTYGGLAVGPAGSPLAGQVLVADTDNHRVQRFTADGSFLGILETGDLPPLQSPLDVAVAPDGTVYVLDGQLDRILRFDPDGRAHDIGYRPPRLVTYNNVSQAERIAAGPGGRLYALEPAALRVHAIGPDGSIERTWGESGNGKLAQPADIAAAPDGSVLVADPSLRQILRYSADGDWQAAVAAPELTAPGVFDVAADGTLVVRNGRRVARLGPEGAWLGDWGQPPRLGSGGWSDVAVAPDQTVYLLAGGSRVQHLRADGLRTEVWGSEGTGAEQLNNAKQLAVAPDGSVYVTDYGNNRVQHFTPDGAFLDTPITAGDGAGQLLRPYGLAIEPDGTLVVADSGHYRILRVTPSGSLLNSLGGGSGTRKYQLQNLRGVAAGPDGTYYATDYNGTTLLATLKRFDIQGTLLNWWMAAGSPGDPLYSAEDIAIAPAGQVYAADVGNHRVVRFDSRGGYLGAWGRAGHALGELYYPDNIALDAQARAWVAESSYLGRTHVFGPELPRVWRTEVFTNPWLAGWPAAITTREGLDLTWSDNLLPEGIPENDWSARSTRTVYMPGTYRIWLTRGGLRLWVGEQLVVDAWDRATAGTAPEVVLPDAPIVFQIEFRDPGDSDALGLIFGSPPTLTLSPSSTLTAWPTVTPTPTPWPTATDLPETRRVHLPWLAKGPEDPNPAPTALPGSPTPPWLGHPEIDVLDYAVDLAAPALGEADIRAVVTVTLRTRQALDYVDLDADPRSILVHRVASDDQTIAFRWIQGEFKHRILSDTRLRIWPGRRVSVGDTLRLVIDYSLRHATFTTLGVGFRYDDWYYGTRALYVRSEPAYVRFWMPSNDHPSDPATIRYTLRVPPGSVAAANGRLLRGDYRAGEGRDAAGLTVFRWEQATAIPAYLLNVIMGDFAVESRDICFNIEAGKGERADCAAARHRVPMTLYRPPAAPRASFFNSLYQPNLDRAAEALVYYSSVFEPYPWDKLGIAMLPHPVAMEYASLIDLDMIQGPSAVHEVIHHWWGDSVRFSHWGDTWISEGFTEYFTGFFDEVTQGRMTGCRQITEPLSRPPDLDPDYAYQQVVYCKGAAAIDDLRARIARLAGLTGQDPKAVDLFLAVMSDLYSHFRFQSTTTADLVAYLRASLPGHLRAAGAAVDETAVQAAVDQWQQRWITQAFAGDAVVQARWPGGEATIVALEQNDWLTQLADIGPLSAPLAWYGTACNDETPVQAVAGKVALIERGTCPFIDKLKNAAAQGAVAAVIFTNEQPLSPLVCLAPCTTAPGIPGVMIERAPGIDLRDRLLGGTAVTATLRTDP